MSAFRLSQPETNRTLPLAAPDPAPAKWTEKHRPARLGDVVGQGFVVAELIDFAAAPYSCAFLFVGPTGIGKTTVAKALANEIGAVEHAGLRVIDSGTQDAETVETVLRDCHYTPMPLPGASGWHLVIVDECDHASAKARNLWLSALENLPPRVVIVFTTNHPEKLEQRFVDRCTRYDFESSAETLAADVQLLIDHVCAAEGIESIPAHTLKGLVDTSGAVSFRRVVESVQRVAVRNRTMARLNGPAPAPAAEVAEVATPEPIPAEVAEVAEVATLDAVDRSHGMPLIADHVALVDCHARGETYGVYYRDGMRWYRAETPGAAHPSILGQALAYYLDSGVATPVASWINRTPQSDPECLFYRPAPEPEPVAEVAPAPPVEQPAEVAPAPARTRRRRTAAEAAPAPAPAPATYCKPVGRIEAIQEIANPDNIWIRGNGPRRNDWCLHTPSPEGFRPTGQSIDVDIAIEWTIEKLTHRPIPIPPLADSAPASSPRAEVAPEPIPAAPVELPPPVAEVARPTRRTRRNPAPVATPPPARDFRESPITNAVRFEDGTGAIRLADRWVNHDIDADGTWIRRTDSHSLQFVGGLIRNGIAWYVETPARISIPAVPAEVAPDVRPDADYLIAFACVVTTFFSAGNPNVQGDTSEYRDGIPSPPQPEPTAPAGSRSATLEIRGKRYGLTATPESIRLESPAGETYEITRSADRAAACNGFVCTCPDHRERRAGLGVKSCKHVQALAATGLLGLLPQTPAPTATPDPAGDRPETPPTPSAGISGADSGPMPGDGSEASAAFVRTHSEESPEQTGRTVGRVNLDRFQGMITIRFDRKPSHETRQGLRNAGWRWSTAGSFWFHDYTEAAEDFAVQFAG